MENYPDKDWLEKYEQIKLKLKPCSKIDEYFTKNEICGKKIHLISMGNVYFPTGNIMVLDPLVGVTRGEIPFFTKVPTGVFPLTTAVVEIDKNFFRYAAVKVSFNDNRAEYLTEALHGNEDIDNLADDSFFGFAVDAGLGTIIDVKTRDAYCDFIEKWENENPDGNTYDDLFAKEFEKNYRENPEYQRKGGDWINYKIPGTDLAIPMFQSGWGDGIYPVYFGYDRNNNICQILIEFIDIESTFTR
ncbi:MAG: DUF4241 domain-containing protein [Prevotellaceae bacterium]|jgi:hypothetical protein|nr:DUF4241 domain-containing protein [Prevotellaceae bacterium]